MEDDMDSNKNLTMPEYLYKMYNGKGAQPRIYVPALCMWAIMFAGYFGNTLVIWATFKNRKLQGSCNYFIAFGCFADIIHMSAHWFSVYTMAITEENFIPYDRCLFYQGVPLTFVTVSIIMTLFVGLDRLASVTFPVIYRRTNKNVIAIGGIVVSIICALYFVVVSVIYSQTPAGKNPVVCFIINSVGGRAFFDWFYFCVLVNLIDLVIYTTVWLILRFKTGVTEEIKKIFRSLLAVMLTITFGWLVNAFIHAIIMPAFVRVEYQYEVMIVFGTPVNLASSGSCVILYIFSDEYRRTFRKLLGLSLTEGGSSTIFTVRSKSEVSKRSTDGFKNMEVNPKQPKPSPRYREGRMLFFN